MLVVDGPADVVQVGGLERQVLQVLGEPDVPEGATTTVAYGSSRIEGPVYLIDRVSIGKDTPTTVANTTVRSDSRNTYIHVCGTYSPTTVTPGRRPLYVLNDDEGRFGPVEEETPLNGFRSWIEVSRNKGELPMRFFINGIEEDLTLPTAIDTVLTDSEQGVMNHDVCDLQGRRVSGQLKSGIYIIEGRKVIIR